MKTRLKEKHWKLGRHYARFVDPVWHPNFKLTAEALEVFIRVESYGRGVCTKQELALAAPLLDGKIQRELTLKLLFDEMADWWSSGAGWFYPIAHTIRTEWLRSPRDKIYIRALIKITRACQKEGFMETMLAFTGMDPMDKQRYLERRLAA